MEISPKRKKNARRADYNRAQIVDEIYGRPDKTAVIVRVIICVHGLIVFSAEFFHDFFFSSVGADGFQAGEHFFRKAV